MIIPSIDLLNGKVVVLRQGKTKEIELQESPIKIAKALACFSEVQVIDLNAAFGSGNNSEIVEQLCRIVNARVGGGIRAIEKAEEIVFFGAKKIIIGTMANREFLSELNKRIDKRKIVVALDSFEGKIVIKGWKEKIEETINQKIFELEPYCNEFLFSFVEKDGTMEGIDFGRIKELKSLTNNKISMAGGISSKEEIEKLEKIGINAVVGMALYSGKIEL